MNLFRNALLASAAVVALASPVWAQGDAPFEPVTDAELQNPDPADWLGWRRTLDHQAFSPLEQINKENVGSLALSWSRAMEPGFQEATPLVHDGIMYLPHPNDVIQAVDATNGDLIWEYRRTLPTEGLSILTSRSLGIWGELIIHNTKDNFVIALNAKTGQLEWETQIREAQGTGTATNGPTIVNGKAISGRGCAGQTSAHGAETCFVAAHDLTNGEELWRFNTIPLPGTPGDETWGDVDYETRRHVGAWMQPSYDPELNLVYVGTSVTSPYAKFYYTDDLDGEHLYQTSTLALNADTGEIVWHQQHIRDHWDLDHPFERILVDTEIAPDASEVKWISDKVEPGKTYKTLSGIPGKTGIFYSFDRATGEFLWARETVVQNTVVDIDTATGRATMNEELIPTEMGQEFDICPAAGGGKDWMAGAYSPQTKAIYYPLQNLCMHMFTNDKDIQIGAFSVAPGKDKAGSVVAISVETGKQLWSYETDAGYFSLVATAGGLVFGGDANRRFRAFDADTGDVLWETILNSQAGGFPITYSVDGKQYVAIATGGTLISNAYWAAAYPDIKAPTGGNSIFVYALPE